MLRFQAKEKLEWTCSHPGKNCWSKPKHAQQSECSMGPVEEHSSKSDPDLQATVTHV